MLSAVRVLLLPRSSIIKVLGSEILFFYFLLPYSMYKVLPSHSLWYMPWQGYTGLCSVLVFVLDHSAPDNHLLLLLLWSLEKTRTVDLLVYLPFGQQLFYYSVEILNGIQEMLLASQSISLLFSSSSRWRVTYRVNTPSLTLPANLDIFRSDLFWRSEIHLNSQLNRTLMRESSSSCLTLTDLVFQCCRSTWTGAD